MSVAQPTIDSLIALPSVAPTSDGASLERRSQLDLTVSCSRTGQSFVQRQYATYPFRLSGPLRLDPLDRSRLYLYMMNSSPGLLAGDDLHVSLHLNDRTRLYLTDQSATKAHTMAIDQPAKVAYAIEVGAAATLEFVPEPLILYADAAVEQTIQITLQPTAHLFLSEMVLPGRLARGEFYRFHRYVSRVQVRTVDRLLFADTTRLEGKLNPFRHSSVFSPLPAIATVIAVQPTVDLQRLSAELDTFTATDEQPIMAASSQLPNCNGLLIRAAAANASSLKTYIRFALNCVRRSRGEPNLPEIPK
ncbi:urease accessory protein UreD [Leptolyngbya sp. FACHB-36]|uniref:urease accessory protein UreD n=1 Tax=Leptolyngbya sp. FACHB-36 TaxID=2692808 RepID=UPI001680F72F|nr:urease accessory protein UreD [Leptolyngbya sp. FACHB-36]MBD2018990.1 urease accessory protein UreD [Leptolyngbya sp. FACHB-36]